MPGAICAGGSIAPPSRTTIFRGAPSGADAVRLRRFLVPRAEVPLAEPACIFFFAALSGAFCRLIAGFCGLAGTVGVVSAGTCRAGAFSTGAAGTPGVCPAEFAEPGSCCHKAIPADGKLSQSAIASAQVNRIAVTTGLFPTRAENARVGAATAPERNRGSVSASPVNVSVGIQFYSVLPPSAVALMDSFSGCRITPSNGVAPTKRPPITLTRRSGNPLSGPRCQERPPSWLSKITPVASLVASMRLWVESKLTEVMSLPGNPLTTCSQVAPPSPLRNAPSREAIMIWLSDAIAAPRMLTTYDGRTACFQVVPLSFDTSTLDRVAATTVEPSARTETKSVCPSTCPPFQVLPWSVLV